jgi:hypothetical protein
MFGYIQIPSGENKYNSLDCFPIKIISIRGFD